MELLKKMVTLYHQITFCKFFNLFRITPVFVGSTASICSDVNMTQFCSTGTQHGYRGMSVGLIPSALQQYYLLLMEIKSLKASLLLRSTHELDK